MYYKTFAILIISSHTHKQYMLQVKTTQPRRYLVRPNQGIVSPNSTETVSILLVDKDRQVLWSTYDRLGQSALDHSKDKFLVQSTAVSNDFASKFSNEPRGEGGQYKAWQLSLSADAAPRSNASGAPRCHCWLVLEELAVSP